jgi:hypothetical protein
MKNRGYKLIIMFFIATLLFACCGLNEKEKEFLLLEKGWGIMGKYIQPEIIEYSQDCFELAESGFDNKLLTLNAKNEFCYIDFTNPKSPRMEIITPGFPGVVGQLGSDAENRVAWVVRGRGVYMIDLDTKKTGHMIAGNSGRVTQVVMTNKENLLFSVITFSGEANLLYAYELGNGTDHGEIGALVIAYYYALGQGRLLIDESNAKTQKYKGWYITDSFFTKEKANPGKVYPGTEPLTEVLMKKQVKGVVFENIKHLHQGKRLLYSYSYSIKDAPPQPVLVRWDEAMEEVQVNLLTFQQMRTETVTYSGPYHISGDGNWMKATRKQWSLDPPMEELVVYHLQDHYPQGMSMPISLGFTNKDPGAFLDHTTLGPLYVEKSSARPGVWFLFKLNDGLQILREEALSIVQKK